MAEHIFYMSGILCLCQHTTVTTSGDVCVYVCVCEQEHVCMHPHVVMGGGRKDSVEQEVVRLTER